MATEKIILSHTRAAAADLSSSQYLAVALNGSEQWALCTALGQKAQGVLQDKPTSGQFGEAAVAGITKAKAGGAVSIGDPLTVDANSKFVKANDADEHVIGYAIEDAAAANVLFKMLITHSGSVAALAGAGQQTFVSSANYSSAGQYTAVKAHSVAGQIVKCAVAGEHAIGILQNAPASAAEAEVKTFGPATAKAGTGGFTPGQELAVEVTSGELIPATEGDLVIAVALATVADAANGSVFVVPCYRKHMATQEAYAALCFSIDAADIADGDLMTDVIPGFAGTIQKVYVICEKAVTTGGKGTTINTEIESTNVTGGVVTLSGTYALGAFVAGTAVTAANTFTAAQKISIEAASTTTFIEGRFQIVIIVSTGITK
jgi:hypothetical protein